MRLINADSLLNEIDLLKDSDWFNDDTNGAKAVREDVINVVEDLCIQQEPTIQSVPIDVLNDIKLDLWMAGINMTDEYQGVWVSFKAIEYIFNKHIMPYEEGDTE